MRLEQGKTVDISAEATKQRLKTYTLAQLYGLRDLLEFAIVPQNEEEQIYLKVLREEVPKCINNLLGFKGE